MNKLLITLIFFPIFLLSQAKETITQNRADYIGIKTKKDFKLEPHVKWFDESYEAYSLDKKLSKN